MNSPRARKDSEMSSRTGSGGGTGVGIEGRGETPTTPNKPRMTVRNPNLSPRRSSIMSTSSRKQSVFQSNASVALEQLTFRPVSVTCFGDFILAQLMSSSRTNYLAIWGPECHQCDAQELTVETAKFCRPLPSGSLNSLSLRIFFLENSVRFIIHGASSERIERWVLSAYGEVRESASKNLETPIDSFTVDRTGDIMISYEENFMILRNHELRVFHSIKFGREIPTHAVTVPQAHTNKLHLIACYESGLVLGWEVPPPRGSTSAELASYFSTPIFQLKLSTKSPLCGIIEVLNNERLNHRRLCVSSRSGQLWLLEWSTRDVLVCREVKHLDLKKSLRYGQPMSNPQAISKHGREEKTPSSTPGINSDFTIMSICPCPDISSEKYTPPGDRPEGISIEQWRHFQSNALSNPSQYSLHFDHKPLVCLLTSQGLTILVDIENFQLIPGLEESRINGVVSLAISSLNVLNHQQNAEENEDDGETSEDSSESESRSKRAAMSPPRTLGRNTVVSPLRMGSPSTNLFLDRGVSPPRRGSVQSRASNRRGSMATCEPLADFRALSHFRKTIAKKYGSSKAIIAFSVFLGGFDRKILVRPLFATTIPPPVVISAKKPSEIRNASQNGKEVVSRTEKRQHVSSEEDAEARIEVSRLPLWAMTLKEQGSSESLPDCNIADQKVDDSSSVPSFSLFHHPYFQSSSLPERSPLLIGRPTSDKQPLSARSKNSLKVRGDWEKPLKSSKGEIIDQPVTFHSRIKSSGYGVADVSGNRWKQKKQLNASNQHRSKSAPRQSNVTDRTTVASRLRTYPRDCGPLTQLQEYNNYPPPVTTICQGPILKLSFSNDGTMIGLISANNDVGTLRTPLGKYRGDGLFYLGHDAQINSLEFAHKSDLIISSSADATARIWKSGRVDSAVVVMSHKRHQPMKIGTTPSSATSRQTSQRNVPFGGAIQAASFYYLDKFVLLTTKTSVLMYSYDLEDLEQENDLKRLQATGKYKLVHEWTYDAAQSLTTTCCLNSVESPTIITSSSDRKVLLLDAITGKISRIVDSSHERNIHCIALPQPSVHSSLPQSQYNVFATSSTDNVISLWDIRSPSTIFRFTDHINRRERIQCAFSPCLRYLATGSEDRTVRVIDIQSGGRQVNKLSGYHRDVVSSVAYHPIHPQLISGSYDGTIRCFTSLDSSA